jgi:hypothetical protein
MLSIQPERPMSRDFCGGDVGFKAYDDGFDLAQGVDSRAAGISREQY